MDPETEKPANVDPAHGGDATGPNWDVLRSQEHLEVYDDYSILVGADGVPQAIWQEGPQSASTNARYRRIARALREGFFTNLVERSRSPEAVLADAAALSEDQVALLDAVVNSVAAQRGRALTTNLLVQLVVKDICPEQDVRLHKGGGGGANFSWREGLSMRQLGSKFIGPDLAERGLLRMNESGAMMTRSFAENYPTSRFYKARIRPTAGSQAWLALVDELEAGILSARAALVYTLGGLWRSSDQFRDLSLDLLRFVQRYLIEAQPTLNQSLELLVEHFEVSEASARLLEVGIHSMEQSLRDLGVPRPGRLRPLMAMRTANLKHGNLGDVELVVDDEFHEVVVEAWDAKFAVGDLRGSVHGLSEKLQHARYVDEGLVVGFICHPAVPTADRGMTAAADLATEVDAHVSVVSFADWVAGRRGFAIAGGVTEGEFAAAWVVAYAESLAQLRRDIAPIDEPSLLWVRTLIDVIRTRL